MSARRSDLLVKEALSAILRNKLRSALSTLGVTVGIASVVAVVALGTAGSAQAEKQLHDLGDNLVWVESGSRDVKGVQTSDSTSLTIGDADAILHNVPRIKAVSPQVDGSVPVAAGDHDWTTRYRGVAPSFLEIRRWTVVNGSPFTDDAVDEARSVILIGQTVKQRLFPDSDPVGQTMRVQGQPFEVVGVLGPKGQSAMGSDQDDQVFLPWSTAMQRLRGKGYTWLDDILCSAASPEDVGPAIEQVTGLMRDRHHSRIKVGETDPKTGNPVYVDDFNIRHPEEMIQASIDMSRTLSNVLLSVASISLLVGGIGIMNVMLVSVTQRTREIGLRMAVGASGSDVLTQFIGEAVMLCVLGGVLGTGLGIAGTFAIGHALDWPVSIPAGALLVAPFVSIATGVFFGAWPAVKASRLDPVEALRAE